MDCSDSFENLYISKYQRLNSWKNTSQVFEISEFKSLLINLYTFLKQNTENLPKKLILLIFQKYIPFHLKYTQEYSETSLKFSDFILNIISNFPKLQNLNIIFDNNQLQYEPEKFSIKQGLSLLKNISILSIFFKKFSKDTFNIAKQLNNSIPKLHNLKKLKLKLQFSTLSEQSIHFLSLTLAKSSHLSILNLNVQDCEINDTGLNRLSLSFPHLKNLKCLSLNLNFNFISNKSLQNLFISIQILSKLQQLSLKLQNTNINFILVPIQNENILQNENLKLVRLDFGCNFSHPKSFKFMLNSFSALTNLQRLDLNLTNNNLKLEGFQNLIDGLTYYIKLECLSLILRDNHISNEGFKLLIAKLAKFPKLKYLKIDLRENHINTQGIKCIKKKIRSLSRKKIFYLDVRDNNMGFDSIKYILEIMKGQTDTTILS